MITNGYTSLQKLKDRFITMAVTDMVDDRTLESIIEAISRAIDGATGQWFYTTTADETRYYTADFDDVLYLDDPLISITTLKTDDDGDGVFEITWTANTHYFLEPFNAALAGKPYKSIWCAYNSSYQFSPSIRRGVQIVGRFGWSAVPKAIEEACLLMAEKLFKRKDAPFGVLGMNQFGGAIKELLTDPELMVLLEPYSRFVYVVG